VNYFISGIPLKVNFCTSKEILTLLENYLYLGTQSLGDYLYLYYGNFESPVIFVLGRMKLADALFLAKFIEISFVSEIYVETRRCKCLWGGDILLLFENKRSIIFKVFVLLFNCLESLNIQSFIYLVAFSFTDFVSLNESFMMVFYKNGTDKLIWLIVSGTAPGQAETFDYSSKMAASKEAAAAAAAKVPVPPDPDPHASVFRIDLAVLDPDPYWDLRIRIQEHGS
jgi:hypothetical protein